MKKLVSILLAALMLLSVAAFAEGDYRVAMITDYGDITDQSFNQTTYEACKAFCEKNAVDFKYYKPTDDSTAARVEMIDQAIAEGYNVVVMPGYAFAGAIVETQDLYPDVKFVALDVSEYDIFSSFYKDGDMDGELIDPSNEPHVSANVFSAVYQEELCGYMAGVAAVKLGYTKLGFLGGMAVPAVIRYGSGFVQGANAAAEELGKDIEINYVYGGQFYGDGDITAAMDTWYQGGTEVVFACGGGIFTSAGEAAAKVGGKVIGVDVDQAATIDGMYGEGMTVTSAMKGLAATVDTLLGEILAGNFKDYGGQIQNLGLVGEDPELNYVQIPMESTQWSDSFTKEDYAALVAAMFAGEVEVSNDITALPEVGSHVTLNDQGQIK